MANPAMVRMLGYDSEEELLALDSTATFLKDSSQRPALVQKFLDSGGADRDPVEWIRKDGETISVLFSGRPVEDESGAVRYFEIMIEDVTERLALEEQLRQGQRLEALGQLAGGVAHDFNNILSVIIIEAQLGMKRLDEDDPVHTRLDEIKQAGDRAAALTSQLLAFSRKQVVEPKVLNVNRVISQMNTMLARLISEDIDLVSELDETLGNVLADQGQLEQIVANLIVNARDSMSKGGQITIRTSMKTPTAAYLRVHPEMQAETLVCLEIQDAGSGIPPEVKAKMFDPFFTTKERGKGTGLGLATVYGIVQRMGGDIEVDSTLGAGTTMRIVLPLVDVEETENAADGEALLTGGDECVLVVEDDARLHRIAVQLLEEHGYTVASCEDGLAALSYLESHDDPIDLLLTDVVMPNMGGRELAESIGESRQGTKVLFMSGYTDDELLESQIAAGEISFLAKPFTAEDLALSVRKVLDEGGIRRGMIPTSNKSSLSGENWLGCGCHLVTGEFGFALQMTRKMVARSMVRRRWRSSNQPSSDERQTS